MREYFGVKELYDVTLKTTLDLKIGNTKFEAGEPILFFEKVQIAMIDEDVSRVFASGGKGNRNLVMWENTQSVDFILQEGVMSRLGLALLTNAEVVERDENKEFVSVPEREELLTDGDGVAKLKYAPNSEPRFVYNIEGNEYQKIVDFSIIDKEVIIPSLPNTNIMVVYYFDYSKDFTVYTIGEKLFNGFLSLEGKIYFKDDQDGLNQTSIFEMPRVRIMSSLDLRIGEKADPVVSVFNLTGFPNDQAGDNTICRWTLLSDDVDYDI